MATAASFSRRETEGKMMVEYWFRDARVVPVEGQTGAGATGWGVFRAAGAEGLLGCNILHGRYTRLAPDRARVFLDRARFRSPVPERGAHALARDAQGVYYYVDRLVAGLDFRLFVGRRGQMKRSS